MIRYHAIHGVVPNITFSLEFCHRRSRFQKQSDSSSCGVYVCLFAKTLLFGGNHTALCCNKMRELLMYELALQGIIPV